MMGAPDDLGNWAGFFDELTAARLAKSEDIAHALEQEHGYGREFRGVPLLGRFDSQPNARGAARFQHAYSVGSVRLP